MQTGHRIARHPSIHRSRAALAAALLVVLIGAGGCGAGDSGGSNAKSAAADRGAERDVTAAGPAAGPAAGSAAGQEEGAKSGDVPKAGPVVTAHVIRTATLRVEVKNVPKAVAAARTAAEGAGGLVADESTRRIDDTHDTSRLVLRVPQERYDEVLGSLAGSGKLLSRTSNAKDVTGEVVDVDSRIATQRASVARVRALMDRAERLTDVVELEGELSNRQAALESLLAQQASLKDRTSLATITLELTEPDVPVKAEEDDDPGFVDALAGGWDAFVTTLRWIAVVIGATAPFLAAAGVLLVLWRTLRGRLARLPADPSAAQAAPADPAAGSGVTPAP